MLNRLLETAQILAQLMADDLSGGGRRRFTHRMIRVLLLLAAGVIAATALRAAAAEPVRPADPLYNVELVIFRAVVPLGVPEDWQVEASAAQPATAGDSDAPAAGAASPSTVGRLAVRTLPAAQFKLTAIESALARSRGYEILRHVGWTQTASPRGESLAVELADLGTDGQPLRGTVAFERGRYLHLRLNLSWAPQSPPASLVSASGNSATPVTFTLKQQRRVRPFERHYFDHPAFGVIAMVSPISGTR